MAAEILERWHRSAAPAMLNGRAYRPVDHTGMPGTPLTVQKGQAEAAFLVAEDQSRWILKRFHKGRAPKRDYLRAVSRLLPAHDGLIAGKQRTILSAQHVGCAQGLFCNAEFRQWIDDSVLMQQVSGADWASVADELRDGSFQLAADERLTLCRSLVELVAALEQSGCAHRDLSSGNVFIHKGSFQVSLIDFDSLYHASLSIPAATTCGTEGYTAPFAMRSGRLDAGNTWCRRADRFALCLLIAEFLSLDAGSPLTADGGMFAQDEIQRRCGSGLHRCAQQLRSKHPEVARLFDVTIKSPSFRDCPAPSDWLAIIDRQLGIKAGAPRLEEVETVTFDALKLPAPPAPAWPAPSLAHMPQFDSAMSAAGMSTEVVHEKSLKTVTSAFEGGLREPYIRDQQTLTNHHTQLGAEIATGA